MYGNVKVALIAVGLTLGGLAFGGERGNGVIKEETRDVGDFSRVHVGQGFQAEVRVGPKASVRVKSDENLLRSIRVEVRNGELVTRLDDSISTGTLQLTVVTPKLEGVTSSGGARVTVEAAASPTFQAESSGGSSLTVRGIQSATVDAESSGGSKLTLAGTGRRVKVDASGGSTANLEELTVESMTVDASGAAQVRANVTAALDADVSGASRVQVKGNPAKRNVERSGAASVSFD